MKKNVNQKVTCLCQWMENPVGIEARNPRFSWYLNHVSGIQAAYRLEVSADAGFSMLMWDSGIVKSDDSEAMYGGTPLESGCRYYYRVMVEKQGGGIYESDVSSFVTGLLETVDWDGAWIGGAGMRDHSLRFRCEFTLSEAVEEAAAFVASPNYYLLSCNGKRCGDMVLNNARTDYEKTLLYETWPLSLMKGKNTLGVELGNGWYCMELGARPVAKSEHLFAILVRIKYKSGRVEWRKSGHDDWYFTTKCPVTYNHIYDGEKYDARLEMPGWDKNDFCVQKEWRHAFEQDSPGGRICAQEMEPVRITGERKPKRITRLENGDFTVDFGQNFAGWIRIRLKEKSGHAVTIRHAELVHSDGTLNVVSLKNAKATDVCISDGSEFIYEPRFTYHGFQYVQISGFSGDLKPEDIIGCVVGNDVKYTAKFECSSPILNKLYQNMIWTERSNLCGIPTDCPQRDERLGWLNDMTVRNEGALYNFRLIQMYRKWMRDIRDTQGKYSGALSDTAPFVRMGQKPADPVSTSALLIPWNVYCHYGDKKILEENFFMMKKWTEYLKRHADNYIMEYSPMGDWASPQKWTDANSIGAGSVSAITPPVFMGTGYLYYNYRLLYKIAKALGREEEALSCNSEAEMVKKSFLNTYYNREGWFAKNSQASNAFALLLHMVEGEEKQKVLRNLVKDIEANEFHLTTGNLCSRYVVEVLFEEGYWNEAYRLLTQTSYPSWGYMIENGATTMWERWENIEKEGPGSGMASRNHPMSGAVGVCFHKYLAGLRIDEEEPAFKRILIAPCIPNDLRSVSAEMETIRGIAGCSWEKDAAGNLFVNIEIPFNSTGIFNVPKNYRKEKFEIKIYCAGEVKAEYDSEKVWNIALRSGRYQISLKRA